MDRGAPLRPAVKLAGFAVVVAAAIGVGAAVGTVAGPIEVSDEVGHEVDHVPGPTTTVPAHPTTHEAHGPPVTGVAR